MHTPPKTAQSRSGFTLLEVMVSSFLMAIVMGMLFTILIGTMNAWEGGTSRLQTNSDARMALDMISRDLQSMVARQTQSNQEWLVSRPVEIEGATSTWLTFFAPALDRDSGQEGDIVAISYATGFQDPASTNDIFEIFGLYKQMATTQDTFVDALGQTNILSGFWQAGGTAPDPLLRNGFLVPNVVRFEISWWAKEPGRDDMVRLGPEYEVRLDNVLEVDGSPVPGATLEAADISLTILTEEGMQQARTFAANGNLTEARLSDLIRRFARVHSSRVTINY